jgi:pimeloyl-ACP methyl ester carboxylesterase
MEAHMNTNRRIPRLAASLVAVIVVGWTALAWRSGFLGVDSSARIAPRPSPDDFSAHKRYLDLAGTRVAYVDEGRGPPVILLHGCPFHGFEWRHVVTRLNDQYRVIVPDLLGLGDTEVSLSDDYRLPKDAEMVIALMDALQLPEATIVGHDHGGATLQILMGTHPSRITRAVLSNAEAYDAWPSEPERRYLEWIASPLTSPLVHLALSSTAVRREIFSIAVHDQSTLTDEVLEAFVSPHTSSPERWQRLVRFFRWQLDPAHQQVTIDAVDGMRRFDKPTLLLWGAKDGNFGRAIAERLARDIPGTVETVWLEHSAHLPMLEEPEAYGDALIRFFDGQPTVIGAQP